MRTTLFLLASIISNLIMAQSGWVISNGTYTTHIEKMGEQVVPVDISKNITVSYKIASPDKEMNRTVILFDEKDNEVARKEFGNDAGSATFTTKELAAFFNSRSMLFVYTVAIPKDPAKAALVRVMRVKVCTLEKNNLGSSVIPIKKKPPVKKKGK